MSEGTSVRFDTGEPIWMVQLFHRSYDFDPCGVWSQALNAADEDSARNAVILEFMSQGGNVVLIDQIYIERLEEPSIGNTIEE